MTVPPHGVSTGCVIARVVAASFATTLAASAALRAQQVPLTYTAYRAAGAPLIDGALDDPAWQGAPWSERFVDIEGVRRPDPRLATRVKLLWDDRFLYIGAALEEPDVWATIATRDSVIFRDNDFEVFLDPDGDARDYAELEINALNTVWDLFLAAPYRDGGHADDAWNVAGLETAVRVAGTLNHPGDRDSGWTVEIAIPWRSLERASHTGRAPRAGEAWRVNFSRVEWDVDTAGGAYRKMPDVPEHNWVWSPQGMIDMHQPEQWGFLRFSGQHARPGTTDVPPGPAAAAPPILSGYLARLEGARLDYHSSHPDVDTALLARARRDVQSVAWLTDTVPRSFSGDSVRFVWLAGLSGSKGVRRFDVAVDGRPCFSFVSAADSTVRGWTVTGCGGTLALQVTTVDRFGDLFGYLYLVLPRSVVTSGRPVALRVTGEDAGSSAWYMTFEYRLSMVPRIRQDPALMRGDGGPEAALRVVLDNLAGSREASVQVYGLAPVRQALEFGPNVLRVPGGPLEGGRTQRVVVRLDGVPVQDTVLRLAPVAQRVVYVLPYSHNDIGYSDLQPRVERRQWQNIEEALRLIERTRDYPPEARHKWNVEILWPVESWLAQAAAGQRAEFLAAVRAGSIGLNALYAGVLSGLATQPEMDHYLDYARRLRGREGLPITTALISDIPGQSWGMVTALARNGIRYFAMAPNAGDRIGYTLETWGDRPFWWTSQSGRDSVLVWVAGESYSRFHFARMRLAGERALFGLMRRLDAIGYRFVPVQLPYTVDGDNGPNDEDLADFVRDWNSRYVSPRLVIATHGQLFGDFVARYGDSLPVFRGDFTGYWEDGVASTALETALARRASARLVQAEAVWAIRAPERFPADVAAAGWRDVVLWDEHTWGAAASIETPDAPDVRSQWEYKRRFPLEADSLSRVLLARALDAGDEPPVEDAFDVYNTLSWPRTGLVLAPAALARAGDRVTDERRRPVPSQRLASGGLAVLAQGVPALAAHRFFVHAGAASTTGTARVRGLTLENDRLAATIDTVSGVLASLIWKATGAELVDRGGGRGLGEYRYVPGRDTAAARGVTNLRWRVTERGPLVVAVVLEGEAPGARAWRRTVRLVDGAGGVEIETTIDKAPVRDKEAVHLAFPFLVPEGEVRWDVASGIVRPDSDQLAGSSRNTVNVQSWVDVSNRSGGVTLAAPDTPLFEVGGMNAEPPWLRSLPHTQTLYAYPMNNYWHTNYKADQEGPVTLRYAVRPHGPLRAEEAVRFGRETREPLLVGPARGSEAMADPLLDLAPGVVSVTSVRPGSDMRSWIVALYNASSAPQRVTLRWRSPVRMSVTDADERAGGTINGPLPLAPFGTALVRVESW